MRAATIFPGSFAEMNARAAAPSSRGSTASAASSSVRPCASSSSSRCTATSVSVSLVNLCPLATSGALSASKFSMIAVWMTAVTPPQSTCGAARDGRVLRLNGDPKDRLGAGRTDQQAAGRSECRLGALLRGAERVVRFPLAAARGLHVARELRPELHLVGKLRERATLRAREVKHLERCEDAVARCGVLAEDDVPGGLAAELGAKPFHGFADIAIADLRALEANAVVSEHRLEAAVRHHRTDHDLWVELSVTHEVARRERQDEIAVVRPAPLVDDDHAVAVTVEGEPGVGLVVDDDPLECFRRGRAAAVVDVLAVRLVKVREDLRARLREHGRRDAVGRAVSAVDSDAHPGKARCLRDEEGLVLLHQPARVTDKPDATLRRARQRVVTGHERLDPILDAVGELLRAVIEELDAVVRRGVVRGADDRPGDELIGLREEREPRCRNMPDEADLHAHRAEPGGERAFQHAATPARVAPDHDRVTRSTEDVTCRPAEPKRELRGQIEIRDAADAVGTEEPRQAIPDYLVRMVSVTRVGCTLWAVVPGGVRTTTSTG